MMRHCMIKQPEVFPGDSFEVFVRMLDNIDDGGMPIATSFKDIVAAFTELGNDEWELVQVLKTRESSEGDIKRNNTYYYFKRGVGPRA